MIGDESQRATLSDLRAVDSFVWCNTWPCYLMITLQGDFSIGGGKAFINPPPISQGHRKFWSLWPTDGEETVFLEAGLGWQVEAAFTGCIKIPFIAVFFRKWPPACDAISRRRSFASALWWKLFFSQQAVISMNCQTCTLKIWSHFKRKRRADRGALRNCVAGYFGADSLWSCCVGSMVKNRSGMKNLLVNHFFFFFFQGP